MRLPELRVDGGAHFAGQSREGTERLAPGTDPSPLPPYPAVANRNGGMTVSTNKERNELARTEMTQTIDPPVPRAPFEPRAWQLPLTSSAC